MQYKRYTMQDIYGKADLPGEGRLQVGTFAIDVGKPASNAIVRVTAHGDDSKIIEELITDSSGQTPEINLAAPPVEYSMEPGQPKPYSEYDVSITMEGYEPMKVKGVQIFPNATACQDARLRPSVDFGGQPEVFTIAEPVLWGTYPPKIPEDSVKELPPSTGFVVLPKVVIPEFVIVHNGVPTDKTAQNYRVPFKDYVKNVASCEIYSNWPESTITANILAIISFTLNRVYTEWYRGKGYNFTITNSTAFDHAFNYGRNIFQELSVIVDEIFNTYVTKPEIRQPLFTQYCDGKKSLCPNWMSQWGSKSLGDQGYGHVEILKNYYGNEVFLMEAEKVEGVPKSFNGPNLQMGSSGDNVRVIQEQLNAISDNYPAIKKMKVDGIFGQGTLAAVERFQEIFRLPATGIVDIGTWYKISDVYVAVKKLAELV